MLNVYVGVSVCGSSGRLLVLRSLYLWATTVIRRHAKHSLMRKMFQSWVGFVLFFLVFTHFFKSPKENFQSPCWSLHACICSLLILRYVFIFLSTEGSVCVYAWARACVCCWRLQQHNWGSWMKILQILTSAVIKVTVSHVGKECYVPFCIDWVEKADILSSL